MRYLILALPLLLAQAPSAQAQIIVDGSVQSPGMSIDLNLPMAPEMVQVPGYPVYYAPEVHANLFFYSGQYWAFQRDHWYASPGYDGPWGRVAPINVPAFVLRVPVSYYRTPPPFFGPWREDAAPHWGEHWGREWAGQRAGWNQWDHRKVPDPVPPPGYRRDHAGDRHLESRQQPREMYSRSDRHDLPDQVERQPIEQQRFDRGQERFEQPRGDGQQRERR
ncbi:MAG: hypothetical protein ABI212_02420 [Burkholderiaceae bacterium]